LGGWSLAVAINLAREEDVVHVRQHWTVEDVLLHRRQGRFVHALILVRCTTYEHVLLETSALDKMSLIVLPYLWQILVSAVSHASQGEPVAFGKVQLLSVDDDWP